LKQGPQIEFLIDQAVDLARPVVGIELAVKSLPVRRFGRPGGFQKNHRGTVVGGCRFLYDQHPK
jgi:hypothetical protein